MTADQSPPSSADVKNGGLNLHDVKNYGTIPPLPQTPSLYGA
jgi:hypothetical protein